ncbi:MAG: hypothetical protein ABSA78_12485 [Candidatus Sulfotelmatobacter sp.]|jgi:hypothetical protein
MKTVVLSLLRVLISTLAFAGVHDSCQTDNHERRVFAVAYPFYDS